MHLEEGRAVNDHQVPVEHIAKLEGLCLVDHREIVHLALTESYEEHHYEESQIKY